MPVCCSSQPEVIDIDNKDKHQYACAAYSFSPNLNSLTMFTYHKCSLEKMSRKETGRYILRSFVTEPEVVFMQLENNPLLLLIKIRVTKWSIRRYWVWIYWFHNLDSVILIIELVGQPDWSINTNLVAVLKH